MKKIIALISIILLCFIILPNHVNASLIKSEYDKDMLKTYYVSNEKENALAINIIRTNMYTKAKIIYSDKMIPKTKNNLKYYYMTEISKCKNLYQDYIITGTKIASYEGFGIVSATYNKNKTVTCICNFYYYDTFDQTNYINAKINTAIISNYSNLKNDYEKAYWAYQWIINNVNTDYSESNFSVYSGFTDAGTVCCGYSILYCAIANKLGLDCRYIEGSVYNSDIDNHVWNIIKLNGKWYCIDVTWGDTKGSPDKYFLKSKETFSTKEYGYHNSKSYNYSTDSNEVFDTNDYSILYNSEVHGVLPSVFNIKMDVLRKNILNIDEGYTFMINNPDNVQLYFNSENPNVAKVDSNGIITGVSIGATEIVAFNKELNIEQRCKITVVANDNNFPILTVNHMDLKIGGKSKIDIKNKLSGSKIKFTSSDPSIAKVYDTGKVTAIKSGKCKISCVITNGTQIYNLKCIVKVSKK